MKNTATFKLMSGVECEITEMTAKHQRILTEQRSKKMGDNLNEIIGDLLVRVGTSHGPFDADFAKALLSADRRQILVKARELSLSEELTPEQIEEGVENDSNIFTFNWDYVDVEGKKQTIEKEVLLEGGDFPMKPYAEQWEEYADIKKDVEFTLPSGKVCIFKMLDGYGEEIGNSVKKSERSSHTPLIMRNVRTMELVGDKSKSLAMQANLDKWSLRDIEALRKKIKEVEGRVDTEERFEHPEADIRPANEKYVIVDLLTIMAFFFPSQAI